MKKNAQIQMGENVIILFIFFILLIFGVVFYTKIQSGKVQQDISEDIEGRGLQIAQQVLFLPELQCTRDGVEIPDCYDLYAMKSFSELSPNPSFRDAYVDLFGFTTITVFSIFPNKDDGEIVLYDNAKTDFTSKLPYYSPIIICDFSKNTEQKVCNFGVLKVDVYN
jgi:hypothetical protein